MIRLQFLILNNSTLERPLITSISHHLLSYVVFYLLKTQYLMLPSNVHTGMVVMEKFAEKFESRF